MSKARRIVRVHVGSAAKVGAILGCAGGFLGGLGAVVWNLSQLGAPAASSPEHLMLLLLPVFAIGVFGLDGLIAGAVGAWVFNLTTRASGGLVFEVEDVAADADT